MAKILNVEIFEDEENKYVLYDDFIKLLERAKELEEENKQLKELNVCVGCNNNPDYKSRINKAIEFLKENADYTGIDFVSDLRYDECLELLKILKGEENDN